MIELEARHQGDKQFARTLARGLGLLGCFTPGEPMLRNKDFVQRTALDKVTVSRLTYTLVELGYLRRDAAAGGYRLGAAVLCLGYPLLASMTLRQKLRPAIREFAETVRGSVGMSLRDRMRMVYFEVVRAEHPSAPPLDVGASFPIVYFLGGYGQEPKDWRRARDLLDLLVATNQIQNMYVAFLPGAGGQKGSFYVNHRVGEADIPDVVGPTSGRYEDVILNDLLPVIETEIAHGRIRK